jgi:pyruvate dehydrogenase E2 component (dihydrolipoamide acetyltransferase)
MSIKEFKLPDPGEGLTEAEVVSWKVKVGDTVKVNDIVVEVETAKSLVELPVPFAGRVEALLVEEGTEVAVGTPIIAIQTDANAGSSPAAPAPAAEASVAPAAPAEPEGEAIEEGKIGGVTSTGRTAVLVGYGVKQTDAVRRPRKSAGGSVSAGSVGADSATGAAGRPSAASPAARTRPLPPDPTSPAAPAAEPAAPSPSVGGKVLAKPPVRKLAKDLGIDLASVPATGEGGIVTRADVEAFAAGGAQAAPASPSSGGGVLASGPGAFAQRGEERIPIKGVRKVSAQAMVDSAFTAPHVTEWVTVDVTATMDLVERLRKDREFKDVKVTPLLVLAKAMCVAVRRHPDINVSWDEAAQEIVRKRYVNLGIAAATPRGLMVPNIKDADLLPMRDLATAIGELTATAREGRTQPADMSGGTITITNVGVFGVDTGTPILNPGEAAIVAFGAIRRMPWVVTAADGTESIEPRWVTQLGMSFDHRMVDGELGSKYLADVAAILQDPGRGLVWG